MQETMGSTNIQDAGYQQVKKIVKEERNTRISPLTAN